MDFTVNSEQEQILSALALLLERHAGRDRAMSLLGSAAYDHLLHEHLASAGYMQQVEGFGPLEVALAGIEVARSVGTVSYFATTLVAPMVLQHSFDGPVALARSAQANMRFGGAARLALVMDDADALAVPTLAEDWVAVDNNSAGVPVGRLKPEVMKRASRVKLAAAPLRDWWRVAIASEVAGAMSGALNLTVAYVRDRSQFGRPIGSFQAVQHRLAHLALLCEGARWLALEAASKGARRDLAATAAAFATGAIDQVFRECHQLHGAIGFTREYPLHLWTMRLLQLQVELGGPSAHRRDAAEFTFRDQSVVTALASV